MLGGYVNQLIIIYMFGMFGMFGMLGYVNQLIIYVPNQR